MRPCLPLFAVLLVTRLLAAPAPNDIAPALTAANPDMLSGGLTAALGGPGVAAAKDDATDLSKPLRGTLLDVRVGANVRLGRDAAILPDIQIGQAEPHLIRSLTQPRVLLAAFQDGRYSDGGGALNCGYAVSHDGGITWARDQIPLLTTYTGGPYNRATDPVCGAGPNGELYLNTLGSISGTFGRAAVLVSRSLDEGRTWTAPHVVYESPSGQVSPDKNWITVNPHAGPTRGRLAVTWTNFTSNTTGGSTGNYLVAATSDDQGTTWTSPVAITQPGSANQGTQPVFLPDGSLLVVYVRFTNAANTAQFTIECKRSSDGGRTFPNTATPVVTFVNGWDDPDLREGVFLPSVAVARDTGEVFVAYVSLVDGTPRVLVTRSVDRGASWSAPTIASDNPAGVSVVNASLDVAADGRTVSVIFMDKRHAPVGSRSFDIYAANSFDGGDSWPANLRLSDVSSDITRGPPTARGYMFGDYLGVAAAAGSEPFVAIWCDSRTGDSDPFTARYVAQPVPSGPAAFDVWSRARDLPTGTPAADTDQDGISNYLEYLEGSDPRRPSTRGEHLVIERRSSTQVVAAWAERAQVSRLPGVRDGVVLTPWSPTAPVPDPPVILEPTATAAELPNRALPDGFVWRGVTFTTGERSPPATLGAATSEGSPGTPLPGGAVAETPHLITRVVDFGGGVLEWSEATSLSTPSRLVNVSTRGVTSSGDRQMIVGFVLEGAKPILVRGAGPALSAYGVPNALSQTSLVLQGPGTAGPVLTNAGWSSAVDASLFQRVGAFPFDPGSADSSLALTGAMGSYTVRLSSPLGQTGSVLGEVYDADTGTDLVARPRLLNLSTRGYVGSRPDEALFAGFFLGGEGPRRVLIRAIGPTLREFGVTEPLVDPVLTVNAIHAAWSPGHNDDWQLGRGAAAIPAVGEQVGAFPLPAGSRDAAILLTLPPGGYTVTVRGSGAATGVALVEVYDAD